MRILREFATNPSKDAILRALTDATNAAYAEQLKARRRDGRGWDLGRLATEAAYRQQLRDRLVALRALQRAAMEMAP